MEAIYKIFYYLSTKKMQGKWQEHRQNTGNLVLIGAWQPCIDLKAFLTLHSNFSEQLHQQDDERGMMDRLTEVSVNNEEDQLVAEATSSMRCLHIVNHYTSDDPHSNHRDGENCTCNKTGSLKSAANVPTMCEYCSKHDSKCSTEQGGCRLSEVRDDSGTEDSSLSSETPSDSSDTSDSSDSSTDSSDTEELDKEPQSDINKMGNVQLRE